MTAGGPEELVLVRELLQQPSQEKVNRFRIGLMWVLRPQALQVDHLVREPGGEGVPRSCVFHTLPPPIFQRTLERKCQ